MMVFEQELHNTNNQKIMKSASRPFQRQLTKEEIENCELIALWKAIEDFQPTKGSKFTSILYTRVRWECLKELRQMKPINASPLNSGLIEDNRPYFYSINDIIIDVPSEHYNILYKRFVEDKTFGEIGADIGLSGESARLKTKKAIEYIKNIIEIEP